MNILPLRPFIEKSALSKNIKVKKAADALLDQVEQAQEAEEVTQPTLHSQEKNEPLNNRPKDDVDQKLDTWMPDIAEPEPDASEFGKAAASYTSDVDIGALDHKTRDNILKFIPGTTKNNKVVQYGMVVTELLPKADKHNFESAEKHVSKDESKLGRRAIADKFQSKVNSKYILLLNDKIIDGHHFLAMAKLLNISNSLKVLDLTPIRFQKSASLFDRLTSSYVAKNHSRQGTA